jgi:hypothetical protein
MGVSCETVLVLSIVGRSRVWDVVQYSDGEVVSCFQWRTIHSVAIVERFSLYVGMYPENRRDYRPLIIWKRNVVINLVSWAA